MQYVFFVMLTEAAHNCPVGGSRKFTGEAFNGSFDEARQGIAITLHCAYRGHAATLVPLFLTLLTLDASVVHALQSAGQGSGLSTPKAQFPAKTVALAQQVPNLLPQVDQFTPRARAPRTCLARGRHRDRSGQTPRRAICLSRRSRGPGFATLGLTIVVLARLRLARPARR